MRLTAFVLIGAVGLILSFVLYRELRTGETAGVAEQFRKDAQERIRVIERELNSQLEIVHSLRAFFDGSTFVDRDEFRLFTASALKRHPHIHALEWAPIVPHAGRAAHEAAARAEGFSDYSIREPVGGAVAPERSAYVPVLYLEPLAGKERALGIDLLTVKEARATMARARESNVKLAIDPRVRYRGGYDPDAFGLLVVAFVEGKGDKQRGYSLGVIKLSEVVKDVLLRVKGEPFSFFLHDEQSRLLFKREIPDATDEFVFRTKSLVGDRVLRVECAPTKKYVAERRTTAPMVIGLSLLVVVCAVLAYLILVTRRAERIEALVKERTAEIRRVSRLQRAILEGAPYSIISTAPDGRIRTFNPAAERMLGYSAGEMIGKQTPAILHKPEEVEARAAALTEQLGRPIAPGFQAFVALALDAGVDVNEWTYVRKDRTEVQVMLSVTALRDDDEEVTGFLGIAEDITKRKQAERELMAAKTAAEDASRTKSQFLANMSHELRTPLNAVIGYSEMLEEDAIAENNKAAVDDLRRITSAGRHLLQLINDVLDLSKIEAGRIEIHNEPVVVEKLLAEVTGTVSQLISEKGNTLEARCDPAIETMVTDVTRVRQILFNLLSNAAKFTANGSVTLDATLERGSRDMVAFTVRDSGIGMSEEQCSRIFRPFAQADGSTTRKYGGTGLGLAICKEFCTLMDGEIDVTSEPEKGSVFTVRLPHIASPEPMPDVVEPVQSGPGTGLTVLVVDDDVNSHELLQRILTREGYSVVCARSGEEGLMLARQHTPAAIVLDVMMPEMDGWEVLAALKAEPGLSAIPVVMLSMVEGQSLGYALGAAEYLVKPIDRDQLLAVLRGVDGRDAAPTALVVEDDEDTREMVRRTLAREGWTVLEAADGAEALERLRDRIPSVILLDLMMPGVDGFEVVEEVRRSSDWAHIPIVVVTARDLTDADRSRLKGRVQKVVRKGEFSRDRLYAEIARLVRHVKPDTGGS